MSGSGTFAGTTYQARVIAYVDTHILSRARLGWSRLFDDTPLAVWGETGGAGDDLRIEFGDRHRPIEVQAKHGLTAGAKLLDAVRSVQERSGAHAMDVVLAVDRKASKTVHHVFAADLDRLQGGRTDDLGKEIERIRTDLGAGADVLQRITVVPVDVDEITDFETKIALHNLESILDDPTRAGAALAILMADANDLCRKRLRRTRKELVDLLAAEKIATRLPGADDHYMRQLDLSKRLLEETKPAAVLSVLGILDADTREREVDPIIRYRSAQHRGAALLMLGRSAEALAAARLAVDLQPAGIHGLLVAMNAAADQRDLALAASFASRVIDIEPDNANAWAARAQIANLSGQAVPSPPPGVADSTAYQMALAQIALNARDWQTLDAITSEVLTRGKREPMLLLLRAQALAGLAEADTSAARAVRLADAERFCTEAFPALDDDHPLRSKMLVARADVYRQRGETEAAERDLTAAVAASNGDPDAIAHLALVQIHRGRPDYALQTLRIAAAEVFPMLLVIRAEARAASGDRDGARTDMDEAIRRADEAPEPDGLRVFAAELALTLDDPDLAERVLDSVTTPIAPEMQATLRGRIAFMRKDAEAMRERFEEAVRYAPAIRPQLFAELARRLLRLGHASAAVEVFAAVGSDALPEGARQAFAAALMETHDFVTAAKLVDEVRRAGEMPEWVLSVQVEIATRQGDAKRAIALLKEIATRRPDDHGLAFEVAQRLVALGEPETALPYLDQLIAAHLSFEPAQQVDLAHVLKAAGRIEEAIPIVFTAIRRAPQDPAIHRGFGSLLATDAPPIMHSGTVTHETYVRLASDGTEREYVIYNDPPIDPLRKELGLTDAATMGLAGKRVGDTIELPGMPPKTWTIVEMLPAVVYVFRDVMARYEERFPGEPFFVHMVQMSDEDSVAFLTPIISTLQKRKEHAYAIFKAYGETTLPLGIVARRLGVGIPEAMQGAMSDEPGLGPLRVEWFDAEGQEESTSVARTASSVVVTRSALETLADLGILDLVLPAYTWCAPQSLVDVLRQELAEAEERVTSGQRSMMASETGIRFVEIEEGDALLIDRADKVRTILAWVSDHARVELRPLETIKAPTSDEEELRSSIADSVDAVQLTDHLGAALLADDLGLRRFLPKGSKGRSFSTVALLPALAKKGLLDANRLDDLLLRLVERNYVAIPPTSSLLVASLRAAHGVTPLVGRVFGLLAGQALDLASATRIAAETVKIALLLPLHVADAARLTTLALDALSMRWPPRIATYHFVRAAATEFTLMPEHFESIQRTAVAFVRART